MSSKKDTNSNKKTVPAESSEKKKSRKSQSVSRQSSQQRKKNVAEKKSLISKRRWKIIRNVTGIVLGLLAVYTLISVVSYMITWTSDQSLADVASVTEAQAHNSGGVIGFRWARLLVTKLFGIGAFAIPVILGAASLMCLRRRVQFVRTLLVALFAAVLVSLSGSFIASLFGGDFYFGEGIGGALGAAAVRYLTLLMGPVGVVALLAVVLILLLVLSSNRFAGWISSLGESSKSDNVSAATSDAGEAVKDGDAGADAEHEDALDEEAEDSVSEEEEISEEEEEVSADDDTEDVFEEEIDIESEDVPEAPEDDEEGVAPVVEEPVVTDIELNEDAVSDGEDSPYDTEVEQEPAESGIDGMDVVEMPSIDTSEVPSGGVMERYDPKLDLPHYKYPGLELLKDYGDQWHDVSQDELLRNNMKITDALSEFRINIQKVYAIKGPTVTLYKIVPEPGTKISQIKRLEEDIAMSIGVRGVRVVTLLDKIGIEVPNDRPNTVPMKSILNDPVFRNTKYQLPIVLGYTISQEVLSFDLTKAPHLLVAGATGMGKSVGLNVILTSLLYAKHPSELKFVLIDPKRVELSIYSAIKNHFLAALPGVEKPILTDVENVISTLNSVCTEMESRYMLLEEAHERNIKDYNEKFLDRRLNPLNGHRFLPYIVVVIDEFADLLITAGRELEEPVARLAAKARAVGIHLIIATQRPTTDVITGTIKANFPSRIAFKVQSGIDSRTIIDDVGANKLIGKGDMLVQIAGDEMKRVQCAFIDTDEALNVANFIGSQQGYPSPYQLPECEDEEGGGGNADLSKRDSLFDEAARLIVINQQGSTSLIQRKMEVGYNRAGRIMDQLEAAGIVGPSEGSKARKVLVMDLDQLDNILSNLN